MDIATWLIGLLIGLLLGFIIGWLWQQFKQNQNKAVSVRELEEKYVGKEILAETKQNLQHYRQLSEQKQREAVQIKGELAANQENLRHLQDQVARDEEKLLEMHRFMKTEFKNMANEILEEKSKKFLEINELKLSDVLNPFSDRLKEFKGKVEDTYDKERREVISLKEQIKQLNDMNRQLSGDAVKLTNALKGDSKTQGDWGEWQLEMLLQRAGLIENTHYLKQGTYKQPNDEKLFRPDYVVKLPEEKHLVIDSKVSLKAYHLYFNEEDAALQQQYLQEHLKSVRRHVKELSTKNYQQLNGLSQPDYVLLFLPIEPAMGLIASADFSIYDHALEKNVLIVSPTTLLATLRTVAFIWKQENQKQNVLDIARESGALHDKFVGFLKDMEGIDKSIKATAKAYEAAMNKLNESTKKGDTIIGRIQRIKELGADASKSIPKHFLTHNLQDTSNEEKEGEPDA